MQILLANQLWPNLGSVQSLQTYKCVCMIITIYQYVFLTIVNYKSIFFKYFFFQLFNVSFIFQYQYQCDCMLKTVVCWFCSQLLSTWRKKHIYMVFSFIHIYYLKKLKPSQYLIALVFD